MPHTRREGRSALNSKDQGTLYSTTEGRQKFPDILQTSYGDKSVIGFGRYGRALGAVVPMEAVRVLAGFDDCVDEDVKRRIQRTARSLLEILPSEAALCGIADEAAEEPELTTLEDLQERRKHRSTKRAVAKR